VTGRPFETNLLHKPAGLKAKRLLLIGGGSGEKVHQLRSAAHCRSGRAHAQSARHPQLCFDRALRHSCRRKRCEPSSKARWLEISIPITIAATAKIRKSTPSPSSPAATAIRLRSKKRRQEALIIGESQNFTRDLVNEPSNRMTPTILGERAQKMCEEVGLKCEVYGADKIKELKMGAFWGVAQGSDEPPALIVMKYEPAGAPDKPGAGTCGQRHHLRHWWDLDQARRRHGEDEVRHGRRRDHDRRHARHCAAEAEGKGHRHRVRHREHALRQSAKAGRRADCHVRQIDRNH
jgi:leucyl aminopeptidase